MAAACEGDVLRPWMKAAAIWYVTQVKRPNRGELKRYLIATTRQQFSLGTVRKLLENPAWQTFCDQCEAELLFRARHDAESKLPGVVDKHFHAIEALHAAQDWATMVKYTNPLMERIWPKQEAHAPVAQVVQIMVGSPGSFAARHASGDHEVEIAGVAVVGERPAA